MDVANHPGIMPNRVPVLTTDESALSSQSSPQLAFTPRNKPFPGTPPHLSYYGGRVITSVRIVQVDWNSSGAVFEPYVKDGETEAFYSGITNSRYLDMLSEYDTTTGPAVDGHPWSRQGIGSGTFGGRFEITPSNDSASLTDDDVRTELAAQIANGHLPAPTVDGHANTNTVYFLHFPKGKAIAIEGFTSCHEYCAYHNTYVSASGSGTSQELYYAVIPDFSVGSGCETCVPKVTGMQSMTVVASHELGEAITDPEIGLVPSPITYDAAGLPLLRPAAWYNNDLSEIFLGRGGENGDICHGRAATVTDANGASWTVQQLWSNLFNECVVSHLSNGGFELNRTASLNAWSTSGPVQATAISHTGRGSLLLGSGATAAPAGESKASQTFDLPDPYALGTVVDRANPNVVSLGTVTLSLWYSQSCADLASGSWNASLIDVATGATIPIVPTMCSHVSNFTQAIADVTRFHGRTVKLSLTNEDTAGTTRALTLVDDVSVASNGTGAPSAILNPSFEAVNYGVTPPVPTDWTIAGVAARAYRNMTGSSAVVTGNTSPTGGPTPVAGDSSVSQTFMAPAGVSTIGLWVLPVCAGTVAEDWVTATLVDNTSGTQATLMPRTCVNSGDLDTALWTRVTGSINPGHSYTLTMKSHDDGAAGTATYAFWDDVTVF